ncbi:MAG: MFS transporter [Candidatus Omnitrophica bacterium]|nr:MFS transporter [Candidatus Omnitrophota bacterium]
MMDERTENRIIFLLLCAGSVIIAFNLAALTIVIPSMSGELRSTDIAVARMINFYMIPYGLGALIYAPLTTKVSYRKVLGFCYLIFGISCLVCAVSRTLFGLFAGSMGAGIAAAGITPLALMLIGDLYEKNQRGRLVGLFFGASFFSSLAGIVLAGIASWRWLFIVPAIMAALTAGWLWAFRWPLLGRTHQARVDYTLIFRETRIRETFIFILTISLLYHAAQKWFGVYLARDYGLDKLTVSFLFIMMSMASLAGQLIGGKVSDQQGRGSSCFVGLLALGSGAMLLVWKYPFWGLAGVLCLFSMGWTIGHNGISTILTDYPDEHRPMIASLNSALRFASGGIGFLISSYFVRYGFGLTFFGIGVLLLALFWPLRRIIKGEA